jgi:hypothetical protein
MKRALAGLAFGLAVSLAAPALAQPPAAVAPDEGTAAVKDQGESEEDQERGWIKRLDEAAARLAAAQRSIDRLEGTKGRGASRRYPRGEAKGKYLDDLEAARKELAAAQEALPEVIEEARRAGIPNGTLDRYENPEPGDEPGVEEVPAEDEDDS